MNNYKVSDAGVQLIKESEGKKLTTYRCSAGYPTIGYGHKLKSGENYTTITEAQAEALLRKDLKTAEYTINKAVVVEITQGQFDALVSLVFNWGGGNFLRSNGLKRLNRSDYQGALEEFSEVNRANGQQSKGLVKRRAAEAKMFNGTYNLAELNVNKRGLR